MSDEELHGGEVFGKMIGAYGERLADFDGVWQPQKGRETF